MTGGDVAREREVERQAFDHLMRLAERTPRDHIAYYEREIERHPNNAFARSVLLGWYAERALRSFAYSRRAGGPVHSELDAHRDWFLERLPDVGIVTSAPLGKDETESWRLAAVTHPDNAGVLANAALHLQWSHKDEAISLLRRAVELEPANPKHRLSLAGALSWHPHGEIDPEKCEEAYQLVRNVEAETGANKEVLSRLTALARETKRFDESDERAIRLHELALEEGDEALRLSALQGRIRTALDREDAKLAGELLLEIASGRLCERWIAPDEHLLARLVRNGQRRAVIDLCRALDNAPPDQRECLENWAILLEAGANPRWSWTEAE